MNNGNTIGGNLRLISMGKNVNATEENLPEMLNKNHYTTYPLEYKNSSADAKLVLFHVLQLLKFPFVTIPYFCESLWIIV